jgi:hypothetical protein
MGQPRFTRRSSSVHSPREPLPAFRRAVRRAVTLEVEIYFPDRDEPFVCEASDLSPFGMWFETSELLEPGDPVLVSFRLPRWPAAFDLTICGQVARVSWGRRQSDGGLTGMALSFVDLTETELDDMEACLRDLPPRGEVHASDTGSS